MQLDFSIDMQMFEILTRAVFHMTLGFPLFPPVVSENLTLSFQAWIHPLHGVALFTELSHAVIVVFVPNWNLQEFVCQLTKT